MQLDQLLGQKAVQQYLDQLKAQGVPPATLERSFLTRRRILKESNISQQSGDHHQTKSDQGAGVSIPKINHILAIFLNLTDINKNNIQAIISPVKINRLTEKSEITAAKNGLRFFRRLTVINLPYLCN